MCSICGFIDYHDSKKDSKILLEKMNKALTHRGVDGSGCFTFAHGGFCHNRLSVMDVQNGAQPMSKKYGAHTYTICYNGEIYNCEDLRKTLTEKGAEFTTNCDTEVVLYSYIFFGKKCVQYLNGIFAFAIYDSESDEVFFARDRFGVKPLYYARVGSTLYFASEIKALFEVGVKPIIDKKGLWQLMFLAPITLEGETVFKNIYQVKPAHCGTFSRKGLYLYRYFSLTPERLDITPFEAAKHTRELLCDTVARQIISDVPLCTFLSGGLDSSALTALAKDEFTKRGRTLSTYSFEYEDNKQNFVSSMFQPKSDDDFALYLADYLGTDHTVLTAPTNSLCDLLPDATYYRDLPGQADIDSSLLFFCGQVKREHTVALSGECSDEIFGGYPWFYRPEMLESEFFPFIHDPFARVRLFNKDFVDAEEGYRYLSRIYRADIESVKTLESDSPATRVARRATHLSTKYFMTNLLERKDRMSMAHSLEVRVPFADHRLMQFVYNVPWEIKFENGVEKALLRNALQGILPEKILWRKKSPYPKTHNPKYEQLVLSRLEKSLAGDSPLGGILDHKIYNELKTSQGATWFGQLMQKPQLIAWLIQFDFFLKHYNCEFE